MFILLCIGLIKYLLPIWPHYIQKRKLYVWIHLKVLGVYVKTIFRLNRDYLKLENPCFLKY
ncbi:hypothetical protein COF61_20215 [Bacillus toyonensis]|nr:hypothetical protein COF61_20215 [Bacillus toyonensis]